MIHERHVSKAVGHETFDTDAGIPAAEHDIVITIISWDQRLSFRGPESSDQVQPLVLLISIAFPHQISKDRFPVRKELFYLSEERHRRIPSVFFLYKVVPEAAGQRRSLISPI